MTQSSEPRMIVGLDIGTSKVVAIVGEVLPDGELEVVGIGSHPSRGLKKGVVVNIESTVHSIQRAIEEAEPFVRVAEGSEGLATGRNCTNDGDAAAGIVVCLPDRIGDFEQGTTVLRGAVQRAPKGAY